MEYPSEGFPVLDSDRIASQWWALEMIDPMTSTSRDMPTEVPEVLHSGHIHSFLIC